jgi:hypothetical protein
MQRNTYNILRKRERHSLIDRERGGGEREEREGKSCRKTLNEKEKWGKIKEYKRDRRHS